MNSSMHLEREDLKRAVKTHWEEDPCNTRYADSPDRLRFFKELSQRRYEKEPNILKLARFESAGGARVLEIGVGAGVDFANWIRHGADVVGVDFTQEAISLTRENATLQGYSSGSFALVEADAERLPFEDDSFDVVYAYGVLHHTPDTEKAVREAFRVLREGGQLRCMIYHVPSWTAINLWLYHGLYKLQPWKSFKRVIFEHLESPGTKAYTVREARELVRRVGFHECSISLFLDCGDLLDFKLGKKYDRNILVKTAVRLYPRKLIRWLDGRRARLGTTMHIEAVKGVSPEPRQVGLST